MRKETTVAHRMPDRVCPGGQCDDVCLLKCVCELHNHNGRTSCFNRCTCTHRSLTLYAAADAENNFDGTGCALVSFSLTTLTLAHHLIKFQTQHTHHRHINLSIFSTNFFLSTRQIVHALYSILLFVQDFPKQIFIDKNHSKQSELVWNATTSWLNGTP